MDSERYRVSNQARKAIRSVVPGGSAGESSFIESCNFFTESGQMTDWEDSLYSIFPEQAGIFADRSSQTLPGTMKPDAGRSGPACDIPSIIAD